MVYLTQYVLVKVHQEGKSEQEPEAETETEAMDKQYLLASFPWLVQICNFV